MDKIIRYNQTLTCAALGWLTAQVLKTLIHLLIYKKFKPERLIGSGGMPSSHAATVCSLALSSFYAYGASSFPFTISVILAFIVMHDAMGVRLETGKQAKVLNAILKENPFHWEPEIAQQRLKELVGHTPLQVICGGILGLLVAVVMEFTVYRV